LQLVNQIAEQYALQHTSPQNKLLQKIIDDTTKNHPLHHMLSGQVQGRLLQFISKLLQPLYILEVGTFTGYSAICLAEGLAANGQLHTIEVREDDAATAQHNFNLCGLDDKIFLHTGNAVNIIPALSFAWDLVFIDADKTGYINYYELILPRLKKGGLIIADNVLFHGQVVENEVTGKNAIAINAFNKHVLKDERTEQVLLTVRDGLLFIIKK
jgi:caffeoyl-CoA O-methyltransferase